MENEEMKDVLMYAWFRENGDYILIGHESVRLTEFEFQQFCYGLKLRQLKGEIKELEFKETCCFFKMVK